VTREWYKTAGKRGMRKQATAYLDYLWTPAVQELIARHHLRPRNPDVLVKDTARPSRWSRFSVAGGKRSKSISLMAGPSIRSWLIRTSRLSRQ
jgi:hypothetical protein